MPERPGDIQVISSESSPTVPSMVSGGGEARALVWPGMGAKTRSLHLIHLMPKDTTCEFKHASEAVYYVVKGEVTAIDLDSDDTHHVSEGGMIFVEPGTKYVLSCSDGPSDVVGGPCPPDPSLYREMA
jgi:glyoxylate utilization-related uncharacterized protein